MLEAADPPVVGAADIDAPIAGLKEPDAPAVFHVGQIINLEDVQLASDWPTNLNPGFVLSIRNNASPRSMSSQLW